jgi:benzoylsuccinyl-CoA thiolase BbsA subunit
MERVRLARRGVLYSFAAVHVAPRGFDAPYVAGYVDLPDGVRVFAQIEAPAEVLRIDQPVEVVLGVVRHEPDGQPVLGYKFKPVGTAHGA